MSTHSEVTGRRLRLGAILLVTTIVVGLAWFLVGRQPAAAEGSPQAVELSDAVLSDDLTDATVLAVGEATHGTAEFRQAWRLVAEKVVEQGFTTIAWEEGAGQMALVDAWVQGGPGTVEDALGSFGFRLNRTQETAELLTWLRELNADRSEAERVHLFGIDVQRPAVDRDVALDWLAGVEPAEAERLRGELADVTTDTFYDDAESYLVTADELLALVTAAAEAGGDVDDVATTHAVLAATALTRGAEVGAAGNTPADRDAAMADQLSAVVERRAAQGSDHTLLFAHNGHVDRVGAATAVEGTTLGEHAVSRWGEDYRVIGTDARVVRLSDAGQEYSFTVTSPVRGVFEGTRLGYLEIDQASAENRAVLTKAMPMPSAGAGFTTIQATVSAMHTVTVTPADSWDAIVYVDETTAVTPVGDLG